MFERPVAYGKVWPTKKWSWKKGKNKMLPEEERKRFKKINTEEYKELLKSDKDLLLFDWIKTKGYI